MSNLSHAVLNGHLTLIANGLHKPSINALGLSNDDWEQLTGNTPWTVSDRPKVSRTLTDLIYASVELLGLPRFRIPAEYVAAVVAVFVAPANIFAASSWVGSDLIASEDLISGKAASPVGTDEVFALVGVAYANAQQHTEFCNRFEANVGRRLAHIMPAAVAVQPQSQEGE